jgi:excisionase family DNA binding protein
MKVFTTGQVAKICKVAPRTVSKWFDSGRLKGYRIPGSQDRRIPREYLIKFLKEHGMPLGDLEDEAMAKVLIVAQDQILIENLRRELPVERSFKVGVAASGFEAGIQAESFHPDCIIVDFSIGRVEALQICQNLRKNVDFTETILIALLPDDGSPLSFDRSAGSSRFKFSIKIWSWLTISTLAIASSSRSPRGMPCSLRNRIKYSRGMRRS